MSEMYDRFSSREDALEWDERTFQEGADTRATHGDGSMVLCPDYSWMDNGRWFEESWKAGWADQDMTELTTKEAP